MIKGFFLTPMLPLKNPKPPGKQFILVKGVG